MPSGVLILALAGLIGLLGTSAARTGERAPQVIEIRGAGQLLDAVSGRSGRTLFVLSRRAGHSVLHRVDVESGSQDDVDLGAEGPTGVAALPGSEEQVLLWRDRMGGVGESAVTLLRLAGRASRKIVGEVDSPVGRILPSPSGRYLASFTGYQCWSGGRDCFASAVSVYSIKTGVREGGVPIKIDEEVVKENPLGGDQATGTRSRFSPEAVSFYWTSSDELVVEAPQSGSLLPTRRVFQRNHEGGWKAAASDEMGGATVRPVAREVVTGEEEVFFEDAGGHGAKTSLRALGVTFSSQGERSPALLRGDATMLTLARQGPDQGGGRTILVELLLPRPPGLR